MKPEGRRTIMAEDRAAAGQARQPWLMVYCETKPTCVSGNVVMLASMIRGIGASHL
jgi:hypothetical protein